MPTDVAGASVPPASAETRPLVESKVAAPGAEPSKDAEQQASEDIARADALLQAWEQGAATAAQAKQPFDLARRSSVRTVGRPKPLLVPSSSRMWTPSLFSSITRPPTVSSSSLSTL